MAGAMRKSMEWLGLGEPRDDYDDYDESPAPAPAAAPRETPRHAEVAQLPQRTPVAQVIDEPQAGDMTRITTIHPRTYNEAKIIGESFRDGTPVIMNLTDMSDADAKRLVDFAAGLVFGLYGSIERVTSKVFLLSPSHIEVESATTETRTTAPRSLFNQS